MKEENKGSSEQKKEKTNESLFTRFERAIPLSGRSGLQTQ
jgi:hypothetical protein